jgi:hypothetical protein
MRFHHEQNPHLVISDELFYVESDIPPGMTLGAFRRARLRTPSRWRRLKELAGGASVVMAQPAA